MQPQDFKEEEKKGGNVVKQKLNSVIYNQTMMKERELISKNTCTICSEVINYMQEEGFGKMKGYGYCRVCDLRMCYDCAMDR